MSLFPAYAAGAEQPAGAGGPQQLVLPELVLAECASPEASAEAELLASDEDIPPRAACPSPPPLPPASRDYYVDTKLDRGNLPVSTLYYPGRPEYRHVGPVIGDADKKKKRKESRSKRYYDSAETDSGTKDAAQVAARVEEMHRALQLTPTDAAAWMQYINFQARYVGAGAALAAAGAARARCGAGGAEGAGAAGAGALRRRWLELARAHLPHDEYVALLKEQLDKESNGRVRAELWVCALEAASGGGGGAGAAAAVAAAAARDLRDPRDYLHVLYFYGSFLSAAGLSETLVLLVELLLAMNYTALGPAPPEPHAETALRDYEDKVVLGGLPLAAAWWRVERARAGAHWRPAAARSEASWGGDGQRGPRAADVAELVLPLVRPQDLLVLAVHVLRWAGVPLLAECPGAALRLLHGGLAGAAAAAEARGAQALLAALWAAPAPAPAPGAAAALLSLAADPPHCFSDEHGYLSWVSAVWSTVASGLGGRAGLALRAWRLRWLGALLALAGDDVERRRLRGAVRGELRATPTPTPTPPHPLLAAEAARALRCPKGALQALRAAIPDPALPHEDILYIARLVGACEDGRGACARWALACGVLRRAPPSAPPTVPPPPALEEEARALCEARCAELEATFPTAEEAAVAGEGEEEGGSGEEPWAALLPAHEQWARARGALATPTRRAQLHRHLLKNAHWAGTGGGGGWRAARYHEAASEALTAGGGAGGAGGAAGALLPLHPHNSLLAAVCGRSPLWSGVGAGGGAVESPAGALGAALPALLHAAQQDWDLQSAERASRVLRRVTSVGVAGGTGGAGALVWALRGEAAARAGRPSAAAAALYRALDLYPHHKWLYARGARWLAGGAGGGAGGAEGGGWEELLDALMERQLRLHALRDELLPP